MLFEKQIRSVTVTVNNFLLLHLEIPTKINMTEIPQSYVSNKVKALRL